MQFLKLGPQSHALNLVFSVSGTSGFFDLGNMYFNMFAGFNDL